MKAIKVNNILYAAVALLSLTLISAAANAQGHEPDKRGAARSEMRSEMRNPGHADANPAPAAHPSPEFAHPAGRPCDAPRHHMRPAPRPVPVVVPAEPVVVEPAPAPAPVPAPVGRVISVTLPSGVTISVG